VREKKYLEHTETTTILRNGVWAPNSPAATIKMRKSALGRHREYSPLAEKLSFQALAGS
jgi:hypothetical protein